MSKTPQDTHWPPDGVQDLAPDSVKAGRPLGFNTPRLTQTKKTKNAARGIEYDIIVVDEPMSFGYSQDDDTTK